jgi:CRISPR-associated protein Csc1
MNIYYCQLTLHDNIFFASREMGILYETEKYLHNWALSYAFFKGIYISHPYGLQGKSAQTPEYLDSNGEQSLTHLNQLGVYVFPAKPLKWSYQINTFKKAQVSYYGKTDKFGEGNAKRNYPANIGRAKELAVGSQYHTFLMSNQQLNLPHWIRVGKWSAKVKVSAYLIPEKALSQDSGDYLCEHPLNPIDLPSNQELLLYNRIVMPPVSLVSQAQLQGNYLQINKQNCSNLPDNFTYFPKQICLPLGVNYGAGNIAKA